jgi:tetratricopeptide (TPR) repeat protein
MPDSAELLEEGRRYEGHGVLDRALESYRRAAEETADPAVVAESLIHQSRVHRCHSDWELALDTARRAQEIARGHRLDSALTDAIIAEANVLICRGDFPEALTIFRRLLDETSDPRVRGIALQNIGSILWQQGQLGAAERALAESLGWFQRAGYALGEAIALNNHGRITLERGNADLAKALLTQARAAAHAIHDAELAALVGLNYAAALDAGGDQAGAVREASGALGYFTTSGNKWREIECLRLIGTINERLGDRDDALRCHERACVLAEEIGARHDLRVIREAIARLRSDMSKRAAGS